jgi:hypothetical protein
MLLLLHPKKNPLPTDFKHPPLSDFQAIQPKPTITLSVTAYHPAVDDSYGSGDAVSATHPDIHAALASVLPATHPPVMDMLGNPTANPLPDWYGTRLNNHHPSTYPIVRWCVVHWIKRNPLTIDSVPTSNLDDKIHGSNIRVGSKPMDAQSNSLPLGRLLPLLLTHICIDATGANIIYSSL